VCVECAAVGSWCFCTSTIGTSAAAESPGRVRQCYPSPGKGRGCPGPDGSNISLSDSDAIRVQVWAWRTLPCRSGEAEGSLRDGPGLAPRRDGFREEVAAGGGPSHLGNVLEVVNVWGRVGGPVWPLRRGPSPRESVLERSPARELGCGMPSGERTPTRKKSIGMCTSKS
jgi:hypothetical protein